MSSLENLPHDILYIILHSLPDSRSLANSILSSKQLHTVYTQHSETLFAASFYRELDDECRQLSFILHNVESTLVLSSLSNKDEHDIDLDATGTFTSSIYTKSEPSCVDPLLSASKADKWSILTNIHNNHKTVCKWSRIFTKEWPIKNAFHFPEMPTIEALTVAPSSDEQSRIMHAVYRHWITTTIFHAIESFAINNTTITTSTTASMSIPDTDQRQRAEAQLLQVIEGLCPTLWDYVYLYTFHYHLRDLLTPAAGKVMRLLPRNTLLTETIVGEYLIISTPLSILLDVQPSSNNQNFDMNVFLRGKGVDVQAFYKNRDVGRDVVCTLRNALRIVDTAIVSGETLLHRHGLDVGAKRIYMQRGQYYDANVCYWLWDEHVWWQAAIWDDDRLKTWGFFMPEV